MTGTASGGSRLPDIDIGVSHDGWGDEAALDALVRRAVAASLDRIALDASHAELSIAFSGDDEVRGLNAQWRGLDKPTNVLSFPAIQIAPGDPLPPLLGDIILALETVEREAALESKALDHHLTHLIVHGFLHLLGYDHMTDSEAETMEQLETRILADLDIPDPYADE